MTERRFSEKRMAKVMEFVAEQVSWEGGVNSNWICQALIDPQLLADLVLLAHYAPQDQLDAFHDMTPLVELPG